MLDDYVSKVSSFAGFLVVVFFFVNQYSRRNSMLDALPTIGYSDPILSYLSALRFYFNSTLMLQEGYEKTRPGLFKIAGFRRWMVFFSGSELIDDVRKASDDVLSGKKLLDEFPQAEYTLKVLNANDTYSADMVRSQLTRNIAVTLEDVREEITMAMEDLIPTCEDKWVKVPFLDTVRRIICRATNRVFVGVPLCRNHDYQNLNLTYATSVLKTGMIIGMFPKPLKPIAFHMLSNIPSQIRQKIELIRPMVEERFAKIEEHGEDWDKPNDMLMWLMNEAKGVERSIEGLARRLLILNFAAIHTTSMSISQVLYRLLAHPEYIKPLREEVDAAISEEGWTKAGVDKMYKMDSFLRETQRLDNFVVLSLKRLVLRSFTFSNGVTIPAGTTISTPTDPIYRNERLYSNPNEFDGFRFAKLRESEGSTMSSRYQSTSTSTEYLTFGLGRHVCPGRFFAVNEIKLLLAYIITMYDIKFEEGQSFPRMFCIAALRFPVSATVMFRRRQK